ncbi:MAG TPA: hypothetical protein VHF47_03780 [Acidimicrobiales bacterium]|nr:hypothetical protein [Acidimicrobiales bacterium]
MSRATLARRYGPLLAVAAVQLLIIAVVPSRAPEATDLSSTFDPRSPGAVVDPETGLVVDPATGQVLGEAGTTGSTVTSGGGTRTSTGGPQGGTGPDSNRGPATTVSESGTFGSTAHCVGGRQYDPAVYAFAPPCLGKWTGNNGGKTAPIGVDSKTIKVVVMRGNYGTVVNEALTRSGSLPGFQEFNDFMNAAAEFINTRYELYGRKVVMEQYQIQAGTGGQGKPEDQRLREEMRTMVQNKKPFAVIWNTPVSSATFDELTKLGVVNLGGFGFTDTFNQQHAPYHWDTHMGGIQLVQMVSDWWCSRMYGNGQAKAQYAGTLKGADLRTQNRRLGVLSTDDPENMTMIDQLDKLIKAKCGANASFGEHLYFYAQDATTAQQQRKSAVDHMLKEPAATSVMCFCDQVAPFFLYDQQEKELYEPENIMVGMGYTDLDSTVQTYDHQLSPNRQADDYPQMQNAFGLAQWARQRARDKDDSAKVWTAITGRTTPPYARSTSQNDWEYYGLLGFLLQTAGPTLTATTIMRNAQAAPPLTAGNLTDVYANGQRSFGPGDFTWNDAMREIYWSPQGTSEYEGRPGTWRPLNNSKWYLRGQLPSSLIALPAKVTYGSPALTGRP